MANLINKVTNLSSRAVGNSNVFLMDDFRQSDSILAHWKQRKEKELAALERECLLDRCNFDEVSALHAKEFISALPFDIDVPSLSVEESGSVLIEWYKKSRGNQPTIFSVVFGKDNYIFSLFLDGSPSAHGALSYTDGSLKLIRNQIKEHFGIVPNARLKNR